ncbi:epimerase [Streptomyces tateyamensis]|uniref:Epimerase n=1 Tax=Streptomyces tateyamensis TaxID=565073 RepID=A0A2V4MVZ6_9ACTN|nr:NAD(P)H-binding protein [Streptomyces tateyamensis]PYC71912.1 epimerase [Streptomyces tateyamensis]
MHIGVFGATGVIGSRVVAEATERGHRVSAFTRDPARLGQDTGAVEWRVADVLDPESVARAIGGVDVVVSAINAGRDWEDAIANAGVLPKAADSLLTALERHPATRVIAVGGAGSLEVRPGLQFCDVDNVADTLPDSLGAPREYISVVWAHRDALNRFRTSNRNWTYVSPSAGLVLPGQRTGRFRVGGNQLLVAADGTSDISAEDLAMAIVDEAELPRHVQRRFTVGY